jgi:signal peptidase I
MIKKEDDMKTEEAAALEKHEKDDFKELLKALAFAAVIALSIRTFLFEPFNIPSGSMFPTLLVGDYLFVEKYSYGYSQYSFPFGLVRFKGRLMESVPERGDIAVFRQPKQPKIDYIKRLVGLPGDRIQVRDGLLFVNDKPVVREYVGPEQLEDTGRLASYSKYIETLPNELKHYIYEVSDNMPLDDTQEFTVPEGHYFAMGDNRDGSLDSRVQDQVGFIPAENLVGRAAFIFFSIDSSGEKCAKEGSLAGLRSRLCKITHWPVSIRYSRMFKRVNVI